MSRQQNAAVTYANHSDSKGYVIDCLNNDRTSSIHHFEDLDTNNSVYLSAETVYLGNQSKTFVEARYYRDGVEREVSTTLKPNPRFDNHLNSMEVLHHYAKLISVSNIYYTLPGLGQVGNLGRIKSKSIGAESNPTVKPLQEKIKRVLKELRTENRSLYHA